MYFMLLHVLSVLMVLSILTVICCNGFTHVDTVFTHLHVFNAFACFSIFCITKCLFCV